MAAKNLTVHRNTIERQHRKQIQKAMVSAAKSMGTQDIAAYAIVGIKVDGAAVSIWDTGSIMPIWAFAPTISAALSRDLEESGIDETWRPSLSERRGLTE